MTSLYPSIQHWVLPYMRNRPQYNVCVNKDFNSDHFSGSSIQYYLAKPNIIIVEGMDTTCHTFQFKLEIHEIWPKQQTVNDISHCVCVYGIMLSDRSCTASCYRDVRPCTK